MVVFSFSLQKHFGDRLFLFMRINIAKKTIRLGYNLIIRSTDFIGDSVVLNAVWIWLEMLDRC